MHGIDWVVGRGSHLNPGMPEQNVAVSQPEQIEMKQEEGRFDRLCNLKQAQRFAPSNMQRPAKCSSRCPPSCKF